MKQTALMSLGMHRSGTSASTGVLKLLGIELGERLAPGHKGINDFGYFEHVDILDLHDAILADLGTSWDGVLPLPEGWWTAPEIGRHAEALRRILDRDFSDAPIWAVKDPRMCRMLPLWLPVLDARGDDVVCLLILRPPAEVAASLARRDGISQEWACHLWLEHNLLVEKESRGRRRAFLLFDDLLSDPEATLAAIGRILGIEWPRPLDQAAQDIRAFLKLDLRHHRSAGRESPGFDSLDSVSLADATFALLTSAGIEGPTPEAIAFAQQRFADRLATLDPAVIDNLRRTSADRARLLGTVRAIYGSWSWKLLKPVRLIENRVRLDHDA